MDRWNGRVALVTGSSSGIGAEICRELVKYGMIVIGCTRHLEKTEVIANEEGVQKSSGRLQPYRCDLSNESEILAMFDKIREEHGHVDVCINSAEPISNSPLLQGNTDDWRNMLNINVLALCICTRESIKSMQEKKIEDGQIIHISSMCGHRVPPNGISFYSGTKFMVRALTEGLRRELKAASSHIRVASISPGFVETGFAYVVQDPAEFKKRYENLNCLQPKDISKSVVYILSTNPRVNVNDILIRPIEQAI